MEACERGGRANVSGKFLEHHVTHTIKAWLKIDPQPFREWDNNWPALVTNYPYTTIYGTQGRSEFCLVMSKIQRIRIECKWQAVSGSVDEKFPYLLACMKNVPEKEIIIIVDGGGAKKAAVEWLKFQTEAIKRKNICVCNMSEFAQWAQRELK